MNFFKDPKYRSIRVVIILVVIVGSVWFVVSNMNQRNSNEGRVYEPDFKKTTNPLME